MNWWYNWGPSVGDPAAVEAAEAEGMRFVPMQWGRWGIDQLAQHIQPGSKIVLGYNEPNHQLQANMTPQEAAALWPQLQAVADKLELLLGSPAAAPCGASCVTPNPFAWWDAFFTACPRCRVDFLATHLYSCSVPALAAYLRQARKYGRPIWLTEFACPNPGGPDVTSWRFMAAALQLLDRDDWVQQYAWYSLSTCGWLGTSNSLMDMSTGKLTELGQLYLSPGPAASSAPGTPDKEGAAGHAVEAEAWEGWAGEEAWSEQCEPCAAQVQRVGGLAALPHEQALHCRESCGFWERRET